MTKHQAGYRNIFNETGKTTSETGEKTVCEYLDRVIYDIDWANGSIDLNAEITVEKSHDGVLWHELEFATTVNLAGASGSHTLIITEITWKYIRPVVTFTAGECDLMVIVKGTNVGA